MGHDSRAPSTRQGPAGTLETDVSEDKRHTTRRTKVRMTVIDEVRLSSMQTGGTLGRILAESEGRRSSVNAYQGDEIEVGPNRASALEASRQAVRVDTSKIGRAQQRLLLRLLEMVKESPTGPVETVFGAVESLRYAIGVEPQTGDLVEASGGDKVYRSPRTPIRWDTDSVIAGYAKPVSPSALSQALGKLERRGLILRDVPWGEHGRTQRVELTTAGRRVAQELRKRPTENSQPRNIAR